MKLSYELMPEEVELYTTHRAIKKSFYILAIILTLIPPFFWGILLLLTASWFNKKKVNKIILTNQRLVVTGVGAINDSVMLGDIKRIFVNGLGIFGAQDVALSLKGKMLPRTIRDVKDSRIQVKKVREIINDSEV